MFQHIAVIYGAIAVFFSNPFDLAILYNVYIYRTRPGQRSRGALLAHPLNPLRERPRPNSDRSGGHCGACFESRRPSEASHGLCGRGRIERLETARSRRSGRRALIGSESEEKPRSLRIKHSGASAPSAGAASDVLCFRNGKGSRALRPFPVPLCLYGHRRRP